MSTAPTDFAKKYYGKRDAFDMYVAWRVSQPDSRNIPLWEHATPEARREWEEIASRTECTEPTSELTAREHAAIALRVPDSGNDWLDAMIRTAQRNDLAKASMQGMRANPEYSASSSQVAFYAYEDADAMLSGAATLKEPS